MATANIRRKVGVGLLGSGVVGEAIQDILFKDLKGQVGNDVELAIRKIYTRNPRGKNGSANAKSCLPAGLRKSSIIRGSISSSKLWASNRRRSCRSFAIIFCALSETVSRW